MLVWWQGHIPENLGVGFGVDEIYSTAYQHVATVSAGNGYQADLHEMQITPQGSAFITAYTLVDADLSSAGGPRQGILQDAILQEIDIPTGLVMFEWHAYGHVALSDSYSAPPSSGGTPWDFFHINSISLDPSGDGNFIVSARNTWTAYEVEHVTGAVLWRLGGKHSSFKMGSGTGTAWQHDVRWQPDGTLTIFDDGATPKEHSQSRAIRERIDWGITRQAGRPRRAHARSAERQPGQRSGAGERQLVRGLGRRALLQRIRSSTGRCSSTGTSRLPGSPTAPFASRGAPLRRASRAWRWLPAPRRRGRPCT